MQNYVYLVDITHPTGDQFTAGVFLDEQNAIKFIKENYPQPRDKFTPVDVSDTSNDKIYIDDDANGCFLLVEKDDQSFILPQQSTLAEIGYTGPIVVQIRMKQIKDAR